LRGRERRRAFNAIIPFDGALEHADRVVTKVYDFVAAELGGTSSSS